jgi:quercetin dioxygenase-like cupin family protein
MKAPRRDLLLLVTLAAATATPALGQDVVPAVRPASSGIQSAAQDQQKLRYSVLFADQQGVTHFRDEYLVWQESAGNARLLVTPYLNAEKIGFFRMPPGLSMDWHPAPSKRFVMVLSGIGQVEAGDGERRTFAPGSVLLVTDTQGPGHRTIVVGEQDVVAVWVPIP